MAKPIIDMDSDVEEESKGPDGPPPVKRARKAPTSVREPVKGEKETGNLAQRRNNGQRCNLLHMPMVILYETLALLGPHDLLALARTSRILRKTLMSPRTLTIWKEARKRTGAPEPPPSHNEVWWANLLFGSRTCMNCGCIGDNNVDWQLLMRVCTSCKRLNLLTPIKFRQEYPDRDAAFLDLILYTNVGGWAYGPPRTARYYWKGDVEDMFQQGDKYEKDVTSCKSGAKAMYERFAKERALYVSAVNEHASLCATWFIACERQKELEGEMLVAKRKESIKAHLQGTLGHDERDVDKALRDWHVTVDSKELTDAKWPKTLAEWEKVVAERRIQRIDQDHKPLIAQRKRLATEAYDDVYRKTFGPQEWTTLHWLSLPASNAVLALDAVRTLIYRDVDTTVVASDFQRVLPSCASHVETTRARAEVWGRRDITKAIQQIKTDAILQVGEDADASVLNLAMATFAVKTHNGGELFEQCLRYHECVFYHRQCLHEPYYMHERYSLYDKNASVVVKSLLDVLELPTATTTFAELDQRDPRLFCAHCPKQKVDGAWCRPSFRWRSAVVHHAKRHTARNLQPGWQSLSEEETSRSRAEEGFELIKEKTWSCAHCGEHLDNWQPKLYVEAHVRAAHKIASPQTSTDVLCMPVILVDVKPIQISVDGPPLDEAEVAALPNCLCIVCPNLSRRFTQAGVRSHLSGKHKLQTIIQNVHWRRDE